nr:hypothetical protein [Tanacetum cinerariifolium]
VLALETVKDAQATEIIALKARIKNMEKKLDKEKVLEEPENTMIEVKQEGYEENIRKRPCRRLKMKATKKFDRMDLEELYNLVMQRFETTSPECVDLVLWGDLRTMFEVTVDDDLWKNQEEWILKSWNFYENYGVHTLTIEDGTEIYMLAERSQLSWCFAVLLKNDKDRKLIKEKFKELQCVWIHPPGVQEAQNKET